MRSSGKQPESVTFLVIVAGGVPLVVLLVSGFAHLISLPRFVHILRRQRVMPSGAVNFIATVVTIVEIILPLAVVVLLLQDRPRTVAPALFVVAALYMLFTIHLARLVRVRPGVPCGCGVGTEPADHVTVMRAVALGLAAVVAGAAGDVAMISPPVGLGQWAVLAVATATLSILSLGLPAAMHLPEWRAEPTSDGSAKSEL